MNSNKTILLVDDTKYNIDIMTRLLSDYDVVVALNGHDALEILQQEQHISLILLDIMMPNMSGFDVCKTIKNNPEFALKSDIPIIFITANPDDEMVQQGYALGAVDYIVKPIRPNELLSRINTHLKLYCYMKEEIEKNKFFALKELIQNLAHQWRQPLSTISTSSSGMLMQKELGLLSDEDFTKLCNMITDQAQYLSSTIENIQFLINNDNNTVHINLSKFINDYFGNLMRSKKRITYDLDIEKNLYINGSASLLFQILEHIFLNACEAMHENQTQILQIKLYPKNKKNILHIQDSGGGIDSKIIDNIFDPYFTTKHKSQGAGLGLYMVKNYILEVFNGEIFVYNQTFEFENTHYKGARFEIIFPAT